MKFVVVLDKAYQEEILFFDTREEADGAAERLQQSSQPDDFRDGAVVIAVAEVLSSQTLEPPAPSNPTERFELAKLRRAGDPASEHEYREARAAFIEYQTKLTHPEKK